MPRRSRTARHDRNATESLSHSNCSSTAIPERWRASSPATNASVSISCLGRSIGGSPRSRMHHDNIACRRCARRITRKSPACSGLPPRPGADRSRGDTDAPKGTEGRKNTAVGRFKASASLVTWPLDGAASSDSHSATSVAGTASLSASPSTLKPACSRAQLSTEPVMGTGCAATVRPLSHATRRLVARVRTTPGLGPRTCGST